MISVNGNKLPWYEGMTISDMIERLGDPYPYVAVRINSQLITKPDFDRYQIPNGSEIFLIPLISGG